MGTHFKIDLLRQLICAGSLNPKSLISLVTYARSKSIQGFLDSLYTEYISTIPLIQARILNSNHYESNFQYKILASEPDYLELSMTPAPHMTEIPYRDATLGNLFCEYKKLTLSHFPAYIKKSPLLLVEHECHFRGLIPMCFPNSRHGCLESFPDLAILPNNLSALGGGL